MHRQYDLTIPLIKDVKCTNCQQLENSDLISDRIDFIDINKLNYEAYNLLHEIGILYNDKILEYIDIKNLNHGDIMYIDNIQLKCIVIFDGYIRLEPTQKEYTYKRQTIDYDSYLPE